MDSDRANIGSRACKGMHPRNNDALPAHAMFESIRYPQKQQPESRLEDRLIWIEDPTTPLLKQGASNGNSYSIRRRATRELSGPTARTIKAWGGASLLNRASIAEATAKNVGA